MIIAFSGCKKAMIISFFAKGFAWLSVSAVGHQ
jgi:hypothetical protein